MSFIVSTQAELLKTKGTASFWLSIIGAAFIPTLLLIALLTNPNIAKTLAKDPWTKFFNLGWQILSVFLLPIFIILTTTLITQIEFKNNAWKQVFASPLTLGNIFFSKFLTIQLMILFCCLLFNIFMILAPLIGNLINPKYHFLDRRIDWEMLLKVNLKTYISILGISAIQYWLSLKFKNFITSVGIGLALVIASVILLNFNWEHITKYPYAFPALTYNSIKKPDRPFIETHEWNSMGYFVIFLLIGFIDMKMRKEKG